MSLSDCRSLVLIGAGSAVFTRGLLADPISAEDLGAWDIRLVDVDEAALTVAARLTELKVRVRGAEDRINVTGSTDESRSARLTTTSCPASARRSASGSNRLTVTGTAPARRNRSDLSAVRVSAVIW